MTKEAKIIEFDRCRKSPMYFIDNYAYIKDFASQKIVKFVMWDFQREVIAAFSQYREVIILKAKQLGISWLMAAYDLQKAQFHQATSVLMMSKGETEAWEKMAKTKFIWSCLPDYLQCSLGQDQAGFITFPALDSKIRALPATKTAGVGETASLVDNDEWDFHPYDYDNYSNLKPTTGDSNAQYIGYSTVDKLRVNCLFKQLYNEALHGENNFHPLFLPYDARPDRNEEWYERTRRDYVGEKIYQMEQNYPRSIEEALSAPSSISFFDHMCLDEMMESAHNAKPVTHNDRDIAAGISKNTIIWKRPIVGHHYVAAADTGEGCGLDDSVMGIMDWRTGELVCAICSNTMTEDIFAMECLAALKYYNDAFIAPEVMVGEGQLFTYKLLESGYENIYYHQEKSKEGVQPLAEKKKKIGWRTTSATRPVILGQLAEDIRNRDIVILSEPAIREMYTFIRNDGRIEAQVGAHDDWVMMLAILVEMRRNGFKPRERTGIKPTSKMKKSPRRHEKRGRW